MISFWSGPQLVIDMLATFLISPLPNINPVQFIHVLIFTFTFNSFITHFSRRYSLINNKKVLLFFRLFIFHELRILIGSIWMITHSFFSSFTKFILESVVAGQESILVERYVSSQWNQVLGICNASLRNMLSSILFGQVQLYNELQWHLLIFRQSPKIYQQLQVRVQFHQ